ncbi:hypothetical protein SAMN05216382_2282 [Sphingomonas palmae]|uniref:Argininosuccinate lyase n=1 Tax=Sphingomonas palmae TaxID=1855283 RepID=A0A1H7RL60_9SPHN|nr:hypothetical protein [Sphingomonas palmae]SEL60943.1 hypothetical protein SAMN05216382_2282 [Sphingomonas palmae]
MKAVLLIAAALPLAACGSTEALKPAPGASLPVAPRGATEKPSVAQLLTPSVQARPTRSNELLTQSKPRKPDEFDLPPQ